MVRAATATACSASISAPVWAWVRTRASIRNPSRRDWRSTSTWVRGRGWHRGMASAVRLAARMPARRATSATPPFSSFPDRTRRMAAAEMRIRPRATASRAVTAFPVTSTMRARPWRSRWLRAGRGERAALALRGRSALDRSAIPLEEIAEEDRGGPLAGLGREAIGFEDDQRVGSGVGHEIGGAQGGQGPRHHAPPLEAHAGGKVGLAAGAVLERLEQLDLDRGPGDRLRSLHAEQGRAHEQVEGDLGRDRVAGEAED